MNNKIKVRNVDHFPESLKFKKNVRLMGNNLNTIKDQKHRENINKLGAQIVKLPR